MTQKSHRPSGPKVKNPPHAADSTPVSREELLARYRRQRALPDDPFEQGGKPVPPPGYRDRIMSQPRPASTFLQPEDTQAPTPPQRMTLSLPQTFAVAARHGDGGRSGRGDYQCTCVFRCRGAGDAGI